VGRWGITFPLDGVSLSGHREVLREAESIGYTDLWTAEVDGPDAFTPQRSRRRTEGPHRLAIASASHARGLAQNAWAVAEGAPRALLSGHRCWRLWRSSGLERHYRSKNLTRA
jgi:hypothetical protein